MGLLDFLGLKRRSRGLELNVDDDALLKFLNVSPGDVTGASALRVAVVYACVKIISESIAKLPVKVYRESEGRLAAVAHPLGNLLHLRPNEHMTASNFFSAIQNASASQEFLQSFYKNGLQTKGLIHYSGEINKEARKVFREQFEEMASGLKNAHRVAMLPIGYEFKALALSMIPIAQVGQQYETKMKGGERG